jgi:hypothetical protein
MRVEQQLQGLLVPGIEFFRRQGLEELGPIETCPFNLPATRRGLGAMGTSFTTGLRPRAMTISSPASARAIRRDRWVLAAWIEIGSSIIELQT